jgi:cell fate (sporulation/competence/biofilm development) regulator YlbF (YheA/YmcA/DUF963 family)
VSVGYIGDERMDELARLSIGLMKEIWLLRDRQMLLERMLERSGTIERSDIERNEPDAKAEAEIRLEIDRMMRRVFDGVFRTGTPDLEKLQDQVRQEIAEEAAAAEAGS